MGFARCGLVSSVFFSYHEINRVYEEAEPINQIVVKLRG